MIESLKWDSNFFNLQVGQVKITEFAQYQDILKGMEGFDLIYTLQPKKFEVRIPGFNLSHEESRMLYRKKLEKTSREIPANVFSIGLTYQKSTVKELYTLAYESGRFSRFNLDKRISKKNFHALYKEWIIKTLSPNSLEKIIIYKKNNEIAGFLTYTIKEKYSSKIGLFAVKEIFQGQGIGTKLLEGLERELIHSGISILFVETQLVNIKACKFYEYFGFKKEKKTILKHYWKE